MLFQKTIFCSLAIIASAIAFSFFLHVRMRSSDVSRYRKLVQESRELRSRRALERHPAHQIRERVQKDIWAVDGTQRLHFRLNSGYSELFLKQKKDKVEAIEELQQIHCLIQEKIDPIAQVQQVRTLTASEGTYYYPSHRFIASSVHLAFYRILGTEFPLTIHEKPFLTGVAQEVSFDAASKIPTFTAHRISAQLDPAQI